MSTEPLLNRARSLWEKLAAVPVSFSPNGDRSVVASPGSQLCPPSWVGIVALGDSAIITAPTESAVPIVRRALARIPADSLTRPEAWRAALPVVDFLGPATLGYISMDEFVPPPTSVAVERLKPGHPDVQELLASVSRDDAAESDIDEITSSVFVLRENTKVVAAAGFQAWPGETAHLCVLTAAAARGRGLARQVAAAAVDQALTDGLFPQWRAMPSASRRVAKALGFRELGTQLSIRVDLPGLAEID